MKTTIVIPARFGSTRLQGKPLMKINGKTMLERVVQLSYTAAKYLNDISILVATDDTRIVEHCEDLGVSSVMTPPTLPSGTDRVAYAIQQLTQKPDFIINMQGDAPLTPPDFLVSLINEFKNAPCDAITPVAQLSWSELDIFRTNKLSTPFSGTTAVFDSETGKAFWFSKSVIPSFRNEENLRLQHNKSPVFRHIGLYGYSLEMLLKFVQLPESPFEKLEGLEQLRLIEHGYALRCVKVDFQGRPNMSGVDSLEDITRAEFLLKQHGELV